MRIIHLLIFFIWWFPAVSAQVARDVFVVVSIPQKFNYSKTALTADLAKAKDIAEARRIILDKGFSEGEIAIHVNPNRANSQYWTLFLGKRFRENLGNSIVLRSKFSADPLMLFSRIDDFKSYLSDSTIYLDTLRIELLLFDANYPDDEYQLELSCSGHATRIVDIPFKKGQILIHEGMIKNCDAMPLDYVIRNKARGDRKLAAGKLYFMRDHELSLLSDIYFYEKENMPSLTPNDRLKRLDDYLRASYGIFVYYPQLKAWFSKKERGT